MTANRFNALFFAVVFLFPGFIFGQYRAKASLDSTNILIGDQVRLFIEVHMPSAARVLKTGIDTLGTIKGVERLKASAVDTFQSGLEAHFSQTFTLTVFDSGAYRLPPIPIEIEENGEIQRIFTNDLGLMVRTIPVEPDTSRLQPIKDIIREPLKWRDFWWFGWILLAIPLLYWAWRLFIRRRLAPEQVPSLAIVRPAHETAFEKLAALKASRLTEQGLFKEYQSELTHIFREYLLHRFGYNALEATTEEILSGLDDLGLDSGWKATLAGVLQNADLVKFAKGHLPLNAHDSAWEAVFQFVQATREEEENIAENKEDLGKN